jgi:sulfur carrier protein ThiS
VSSSRLPRHEVEYSLAYSAMSQIKDSPNAARTVTVTVVFFADLRRFLPRGADGPQRYTVPEGATVAALLATIGIDPDAEVTIAVDGELADRDTPLHDGVEVMLLTPMEGGAAGEATTLVAGEPQPQARRPLSSQGEPWQEEPQPQVRRPLS